MRTSHTQAFTAKTDTLEVLPANPKRKSFRIFNFDSKTMFVVFSQTSKKADGYPILTQKEYFNDFHQGKVFIISDNGDRNIRIQEDTE